MVTNVPRSDWSMNQESSEKSSGPYFNIKTVFFGMTIPLTHWGRDKMDAISKTTLSNAFSWMKMLEFRLKIQKFVPKGPINKIPALVQIMAWRRPGDKPLSEPMLVNFPTHICVSWPQWVNKDNGNAYTGRTASSYTPAVYNCGTIHVLDIYLRSHELDGSLAACYWTRNWFYLIRIL